MNVRKSPREYEDLFEDLMKYTEFESSDKIQTRQDLNRFFEEVKKDSDDKGKGFKVTLPLSSAIAEVIGRLKREGRVIEGAKLKVAKSKRVFSSYSAAKSYGETFKVRDKEVYKTAIIRFRTKDGKFIKDKRLIKRLKAIRKDNPERFVVWKKKSKKKT